jgi:effector-binding domain-containing protein
MDYQCQLIKQSAQPVLSVRFRAAVQDLPRHFQRIYGSVVQYLVELGEHPAGAPFAAYYNMDMKDLDVEAGFPVARPLPGRGDIQPGQMWAGDAVTCLFVGPYDQVGPAYDALTKWIADNGRVPTGVAYEYYLNDPRTTPPQEPQTQIVMPLKPKGAFAVPTVVPTQVG